MTLPAPSDAEIDDALHVMGGAMTYDPPSRWRRAYDVLECALKSCATAYRPASIAYLATLLIGVAILIILIVASIELDPLRWFALLIFIFLLPAAAQDLVRFFIKQRNPLLRRQDEIAAAIAPFAAAASIEPQVDAP